MAKFATGEVPIAMKKLSPTEKPVGSGGIPFLASYFGGLLE
jgi:hypothetical protein